MEDLDLSFFFKTKNEAVDFSKRLDSLSEKIYSTDFNLETVLSEQFGLQKKDKFLVILRDSGIDLASAAALKEFIENLQKKINTLPIISLTIAFEPTDETLAAISEWFVINIKKQAIFDIKVDNKIVAGAAIFYEGKFKDYSVKGKLDETIKKTIERMKAPPIVLHQNPELMTVGR